MGLEYRFWEWSAYCRSQQEVGRRYFMVFLMAQNCGFTGFDEVARHFKGNLQRSDGDRQPPLVTRPGLKLVRQ